MRGLKNGFFHDTLSDFLTGPPKFSDGLPAVVVHPVYTQLMFNITAHTKAIERCRLTPQALESISGKEVNCFLTGIPPDLLLTVQLFKDDNSFHGNWTLSVRNEIGVTSTTIYFDETGEYISLLFVVIFFLRFDQTQLNIRFFIFR